MPDQIQLDPRSFLTPLLKKEIKEVLPSFSPKEYPKLHNLWNSEKKRLEEKNIPFLNEFQKTKRFPSKKNSNLSTLFIATQNGNSRLPNNTNIEIEKAKKQILANQSSQNPHHLLEILIILDIKDWKIFFTEIEKCGTEYCLSNVLFNCKDIAEILKRLTSEKQIALINTQGISPRLINIIYNIEDYKVIVENFIDKTHIELINNYLGEIALSNIIKRNSVNFVFLLKCSDAKLRISLIKYQQPKELKAIIYNAFGLQFVLKELNRSESDVLLECLGEKNLQEIIKDKHDLDLIKSSLKDSNYESFEKFLGKQYLQNLQTKPLNNTHSIILQNIKFQIPQIKGWEQFIQNEEKKQEPFTDNLQSPALREIPYPDSQTSIASSRSSDDLCY